MALKSLLEGLDRGVIDLGYGEVGALGKFRGVIAALSCESRHMVACSQESFHDGDAQVPSSSGHGNSQGHFWRVCRLAALRKIEDVSSDLDASIGGWMLEDRVLDSNGQIVWDIPLFISFRKMKVLSLWLSLSLYAHTASLAGNSMQEALSGSIDATLLDE